MQFPSLRDSASPREPGFVVLRVNSNESGRFRFRDHLAPAACIAVATLALFGTAPWTGRFPWFSDLRFGAVPFRAFAADCAARGEPAWWNPHIGCGLPYTCDSQGAIAYPLDFVWNHVDPLVANFLDLCVHLFAGGLLLYAAALVRGAGRWAATLAACLFVLCGTHFPELHGIPCVRALMWMAAPLLGACLLWRGRTRLGFAIAFVGFAMSVLAGHPQFTLYATPGLVAAAWGPIGGDRRTRVRVVAIVGAAALLGFAAAAMQWFPLLQYLKICHRAGGISLESATKWAIRPAKTLSVLFERKSFGERPILGLATTALATLGVIATPRRAVPFALAAAFALVASMGSFTPLGAALQRVPPYSLFQYPWRHLAAASAALALLVAEGADAWIRGDVSMRARRATAVVVGGLAVVALFVARGSPSVGDAPRLVAGLACLALLAFARPGRAVVAALLVVACVELVLVDGRRYWTDDHVATIAQSKTPAPEFANPPPDVLDGRHRVYSADRPFGEHNLASQFGVDNARAYVALIPARLMQLVRFANTGSLGGEHAIDVPTYEFSIVNWDSPVADVMCIAHVAGDERRPRVDRPNALEEATFVPAARFVGSIEDAAAAISAPGFDPRRVVVIEGEDDGASSAPAAAADPVVTKIETRSTGARIALRPGRAGFLFLGWNWLPGFSATADDRPATIRPADVAFMAVRVPEGARTVVLSYEPPGLATSRAIAAAAAAAALVVLCVLKERR